MDGLQVALQGANRDLDNWLGRVRWHTMDTAFVLGGRVLGLHNHACYNSGPTKSAFHCVRSHVCLLLASWQRCVYLELVGE